MRDLGAHKYHPGDVVGRWTVIRHASPVQRPSGGRQVQRRRVRVRCVCGHQDTILERRLSLGESTGCMSKTCLHATRARADIAFCHRLRAEADDLRRRADEAEVAAMEAAGRMAKAKEKLDRLCSRLETRWR